ncbi:MAG: TIGR02996 domain-containing protein [Myxococcota bacterium]
MSLDAALLTSVLAEPDALEPRLVLADLLSERGDPRGELIGLQCLEHPSEPQRRRSVALLRQHWADWVGSPLALVVDERTVRFDRGFLFSCTLRRSPMWLQQDAVVLPEHALLRRVDVVRDFVPGEAPLTHLLPRLTGLHAAHGLIAEELAALVAEPPPLRELGVVDLDREGMSALLSATLPDLAFLSLEARNRANLVLSLLDRIASVRRIRVGHGELRPWREALLDRALEGVEVRTQGWLLALSQPALRRLDAWPVAELSDDPVGPLIAELETLDVRDLAYIHVRGGRPPGSEAVRRLKRSAKGTPLRLPPSWTREIEP